MLESAGGRKENIAVFGAQDWFGEMALLSGEPRSATIITVKETTVWRLSREAWDELIEKHPTWLLHFCATLSKRLAHLEQQYSQGRDAFNSLAAEFYGSRSPEQQRFFRQASLLNIIDPQTADRRARLARCCGLCSGLEDSISNVAEDAIDGTPEDRQCRPVSRERVHDARRQTEDRVGGVREVPGHA